MRMWRRVARGTNGHPLYAGGLADAVGDTIQRTLCRYVFLQLAKAFPSYEAVPAEAGKAALVTCLLQHMLLSNAC